MPNRQDDIIMWRFHDCESTVRRTSPPGKQPWVQGTLLWRRLLQIPHGMVVEVSQIETINGIGSMLQIQHS